MGPQDSNAEVVLCFKQSPIFIYLEILSICVQIAAMKILFALRVQTVCYESLMGLQSVLHRVVHYVVNHLRKYWPNLKKLSFV